MHNLCKFLQKKYKKSSARPKKSLDLKSRKISIAVHTLISSWRPLLNSTLRTHHDDHVDVINKPHRASWVECSAQLNDKGSNVRREIIKSNMYASTYNKHIISIHPMSCYSITKYMNAWNHPPSTICRQKIYFFRWESGTKHFPTVSRVTVNSTCP